MVHYAERIIDYSDSHLSEEELAQHFTKCEAEAAIERQKERLRNEKMRNFRFVGGML